MKYRVYGIFEGRRWYLLIHSKIGRNIGTSNFTWIMSMTETTFRGTTFDSVAPALKWLEMIAKYSETYKKLGLERIIE